MADALIRRDMNVFGGTSVFWGTRVPVLIIIEDLDAGDRLDDFSQRYPTVSRDQASVVVKRATDVLGESLDEGAA